MRRRKNFDLNPPPHLKFAEVVVNQFDLVSNQALVDQMARHRLSQTEAELMKVRHLVVVVGLVTLPIF